MDKRDAWHFSNTAANKKKLAEAAGTVYHLAQMVDYDRIICWGYDGSKLVCDNETHPYATPEQRATSSDAMQQNLIAEERGEGEALTIIDPESVPEQKKFTTPSNNMIVPPPP